MRAIAAATFTLASGAKTAQEIAEELGEEDHGSIARTLRRLARPKGHRPALVVNLGADSADVSGRVRWGLARA